MFKKPAQIKPSSNIKTSERKRLLSCIADAYSLPLEELTKEETEKILPSTIKKASFVSFEKVSGSIYFDENEVPVWFHTRDSDIYPTIFTLMKYPTILPTIATHPHVLGVLAKGADLMLPGTVPPFDKRAVKGAIVGIVSHDNPQKVTAIGHCKLNMTQFDSVVGRSGVAVEIIHHLDDTLLEKKELTIPVSDTVKEQSNETVPEPKPAKEQKHELPELTTEEIDNLFIKSIKSVNNIELPTPASTFMSYVNKNVPSSITMKKTSWKKASKFLKEMAKLNYIKVKGKDEELSIIQLNITTSESNATPKTKSKPTSTSNASPNTLKVIPLYKPTKNLRLFFNKLDAEYDEYFTAAAAKSLLESYIKKFSLVADDPKLIKPDAELGTKTEMPRDQLLKHFLTKFSPYYQINNSVVYKGTPPKIEIVTELKIGRKVVTRVSNYEKFEIKTETLAKELRNKCSGSSTIVDNDVQVQGPHGKLIIDILKEKGVPVSYINFEDKTKKKKNKK
ncbi:translation initiation factor 2D [Candida albicans P78042]|mgnify:FL=1|uniref:SUI1 domain-containing protein n=2 Tax=Candida albicans TaxID=5476 RepID=A0A1D8PCL3_CANAL|nr:uncharacterized protein CAALFM_C101900CA [Candida albicans SC5314]EEQ42964.1 conserved hypothetical protein [Candida albicans WO-1]KGQ98587.1 translation initiation factor 2D [Candida albicans P37005]KGU33574.1 translation initiation factor 2D [Candida albicans P34048]KGU37406.1 translation initiation factor 2D [Candida albicans P57055]KHC61813.1 translation initiation factor 2D [Candida albicans P37039]KHC85885.1 translation initiation factor 2D [Candida albicans P78042]|eukprot:XP_712958.2 hypothetical protein CAALFM_C101900CA [Candida albicans SC5314]